MTIRFGVHLPLIDFGGPTRTATHLSTYVREAGAMGFDWICANDHLVFRRPWLDGPTALAAVLAEVEAASSPLTIATTVALPVVRGPAQTAAFLTALHTMSGGRLVAGVGPGSSTADYEAAGVPFSERWPRFDEAIRVLRDQLGGDAPPLWLASWGSRTGVKRVAELGDGWLASAYNTDPAGFRTTLDGLEAAGRSAGTFPNALVTTWLHVTERPRDADRMIDEVLAPLLNRSPDDLRARGLPIGSAEQCAQRIDAYARAGVQRILLWPLGKEIDQLTAFSNTVVPLLAVKH